MNNQFTQPKNGVSKETNKEAIARVYSVKKSDVTYLEVDGPVTGYSVLYDKVTQSCWVNVVSGSFVATGSAVSWSIVGKVMTLVTTTGTYTLDQLIPVNTLGLDRVMQAWGQDDAKVAVTQPFTGAIAETQHVQNAKRIDALSAGAVGNGVTNDSAAFNKLEAQSVYSVVDGLGKTYLVDSYPTNKTYINTTFLVGGLTKRANGFFDGATRGTNVIVGDGAGKKLPANPTTSNGTANIAIGEDAMKNGIDVRSSIAIGLRSMHEAVAGKYNVAIGLESLYYVEADGSTFGGTRNVMLGDNTGRFISTGYQNVGGGRNTMQCITTGNNNTAFGTNAIAGKGSLKFKDSQFIQNQTPLTASFTTAIGANSLYYGAGTQSTGVGSGSLTSAKSDSSFCTAMGGDTLAALGKLTSQKGKVQVVDSRTGTYTMTESGIVFALPAHGLAVGYEVIVSLTSGVPYIDYQYYDITAVTTDTFTVSEPMGIITSGNFSLINYATLVNQVTSQRNTAYGAGAMYGVSYGSENVAVGVNAMPLNTGGTQNVSVGDLTMSYAVGATLNTALGYTALRNMQDGSQATSLTNCTGVGFNARVSGNSQIQLGNAGTTPYAYAALQIRSDERDKTEVRDTDLGIEFINGLRPVRGKWNMRDDYYVEQKDGTLSFDEKAYLSKTKMRTREHDWFIAQEVEQLCNKLGVDFAGLHNAKVNGGCDVYSLGYTDFIPPMTKAIQQCWSRMDELEARLAALESK